MLTPFLPRRRSALTGLAVVAATGLVLTAGGGSPPTYAATADEPSPDRGSPGRSLLGGLGDPGPDTDRAPAPPVDWQECDPDDFRTDAVDGSSLVPPGYRCADYDVPLDYDDPDGEQVTLALVSRPADDPDARLGTLVVNPGGPGVEGVDFVAENGEFLFGPEVRARFDIVGMDPRGIGRSTPLQCYEDNETARADLADDEFTGLWPESRTEWQALRRDIRDLADDCRRTAGPIIDHMGTGNVARDLDILRRAVGDDQLTFVGYSYGTQICATYANLYPDRVGALVCDGNIDPVEYATGEPFWQGFLVPNLARADAAVGGDETLEEFFRLCDEAGPDQCGLAPDSAARFEALHQRLDAEPLNLAAPGEPPVPFSEQELVDLANNVLFQPQAWSFGSFFLLLVEQEAMGVPDGEPGDEPPADEPPPGDETVPPVNERYDNTLEGFPGVLCSDNVQPSALWSWRVAIRESDGYFGPFWASGDTQCARWPGFDADAYLGPFDAETVNPVLVVNTLFDPATPYDDAVAHADRLPNSALLTVEGWGHTAAGTSTCADEIVDRYLITRTVPGRDIRCEQDAGPFAVLPDQEPETGQETGPATGEEVAATALGDLVETGDVADAADEIADAATEAAIEAAEAAGDPVTADRIRARRAVLEQATPFLP